MEANLKNLSPIAINTKMQASLPFFICWDVANRTLAFDTVNPEERTVSIILKQVMHTHL